MFRNMPSLRSDCDRVRLIGIWNEKKTGWKCLSVALSLLQKTEHMLGRWLANNVVAFPPQEEMRASMPALRWVSAGLKFVDTKPVSCLTEKPVRW